MIGPERKIRSRNSGGKLISFYINSYAILATFLLVLSLLDLLFSEETDKSSYFAFIAIFMGALAILITKFGIEQKVGCNILYRFEQKQNSILRLILQNEKDKLEHIDTVCLKSIYGELREIDIEKHMKVQPFDRYHIDINLNDYDISEDHLKYYEVVLSTSAGKHKCGKLRERWKP